MYYRLFAMFAHCFPGLCGVAVRFSYTNLIALEVHDAYNIVFLKFAFDVGDSDRKNAGCLLRAEYIRGTFVNMDFPFGESFAVGNPFLYTGYRLGGRDKARANRIGCCNKSTRILSRFPLAIMTVIPSSATLRAIFVFVSIPPRPKLDLVAWI